MGVAKLADAATMMAMTKGMALTPNPSAKAKVMGNIKAAAALLVTTSVNRVVMP